MGHEEQIESRLVEVIGRNHLPGNLFCRIWRTICLCTHNIIYGMVDITQCISNFLNHSHQVRHSNVPIIPTPLLIIFPAPYPRQKTGIKLKRIFFKKAEVKLYDLVSDLLKWPFLIVMIVKLQNSTSRDMLCVF